MKELKHDSKIKIDSGKGFYHNGYVFDNDAYLESEGQLDDKDRNHDDDGKIFLMQECACVDGKEKNRSEYIELGKDEIILFGNIKMQVKFIGNYADMGMLEAVN